MLGFDGIFERARRLRPRIAFSDATDPRVLRAAASLAVEAIVEPVLVGDPVAIERAAAAAGVDLEPLELASSVEPPENLPAIAAAMVLAEEVAGVVSGAAHSPLVTAIRVIGRAPERRVVSSLVLVSLSRPTAAGESVLAFADCGLTPYPDVEQLADIAAATAGSFRSLVGREPRTALLSFSTHGSASHRSVDTVRRAAEQLRSSDPGYPVDGELQLDAALVPEVARTKAPGSEVAGTANVLIFPNMDAASLGCQIARRLAGAWVPGPFLQGLARPFNALDRNGSEREIALVAAVTAVQSMAASI